MYNDYMSQLYELGRKAEDVFEKPFSVFLEWGERSNDAYDSL